MFSMASLINVAESSFAPTGLGASPLCTHGLRPGLYSYAAPQLTTHRRTALGWHAPVSAALLPTSLLRSGLRPAELFVRW
jgi:hypothetical protein